MAERVCVRCGKPATDQHHHPPLGSGGSKEWVGDLIPMCRGCHNALHQKEYVIDVQAGAVFGFGSREDRSGWHLSTGAVPSWSRPLVPADEAEAALTLPVPHSPQQVVDLEPRVRELTEASLGYLCGKFVVLGRLADMCIGLVAEVMHEKYGHYKGEWYKRAAEILTEHSDENISPGRLYDCWHIYRYCREDPERLLLTPRTRLRIEAREHHALEAGREVRAREEAEPWVCPTCHKSYRERPAGLGE